MSTKLQVKRDSNRQDHRDNYYSGDCDVIRVHIKDGQKSFSAHLLDLSVSGVSLGSDQFDNSMMGQTVEIYCHSKTVATKGKIVSIRAGKFSGKIINQAGISFVTKPNTIIRDRRFQTPHNFETLCHGQHPFRYNHTSYYRVIDFSSRGMGMATRLFTNILLPGSKISLELYLPNYGIFPVSVSVIYMRKADDGKYILGCQFNDPSTKLLVAISSYLLTNETNVPSLTELRENGFVVNPDLTKMVTCRYVKNHDEWLQYLNLRLRAQKKEGRWVEETDPYNTLDDFDESARHMMLSLGNTPVGIGRVVFNGGSVERCEHYGKVEIPPWIVAGGFVEASRFATDPNFRRSNIFPMVIKNCFKICIQNGVRYILANCEDSLVPIYEKVGAKVLGQKFNTKFMEEKTLNLMYLDVFDLCRGQGVKPLVWFTFYADILDLDRKFGRVEVPLGRRLYLKLLKRTLGFLMGHLERRILEKVAKQQKVRRKKAEITQITKTS